MSQKKLNEPTNTIDTLVQKLNSLLAPKESTPSEDIPTSIAKPTNSNKENFINTLYKKMPTNKKITPQFLLYGGLGLLLFLGVVASTATNTTRPVTPLPSATPIPTLPPNINQENPVSQKKFINTTHEFSFTHPGLSDKCCYINGPLAGESQIVGNLSDPATVRQGSGKPFDGLSLYVVNLGNTTPDAYMKKEVAALDNQYLIEHQQVSENKSFQNITVANQPTILLQNYSSLTINRYYIQFPKQNKLLYIGASEQRLHSFNKVLGSILKSLEFVESNSCEHDQDCGLNICDCTADLKENIPDSKKVCTVVCTGVPKCVNSQCLLVK